MFRAASGSALFECKVGRMIAGSCFGATAALHGRRQKETVTCVTDCEMYTIGGNALKQIARYVD